MNAGKPLADIDLATSSGFPPIVADGARVLILGSLPSQQSLQKNQYYGNPQNAFWRIMGQLFGAGPELPYSGRTEALRRRRIAVWDVLASSVRPGSMDAAIDIKSAQANDFEAFFDAYPEVTTICFNGKKAEQLFRRLVWPAMCKRADVLRLMSLPSSSPAFAAMPFADKLQQWSRVREVLQ